MATTTALVTLAAGTDTGTGEAVVFWVLAPIAVLASFGMLFSKKAVHSALMLAATMLCLAVLYIVQDAPSSASCRWSSTPARS
jgi:NADH-quinone oxidoreductase subunit J